MSANQSDYERLMKTMVRRYGEGAVKRASVRYELNSIPTGSLALDYALGTGGWPRGHMVGVYGPRDIGKSSSIGLAAIRSAQEKGLRASMILVEPSFDPAWAERLGVDTENLLLAYPENGEDAFGMLHTLVTSPVVDLVVFDSIGALLASSEVEEGGKMKAGGQAGLITWGIKRCIMPIYRNNKCVLMLNQIRDTMNSRYAGLLQQPGGHALEHSESIICELKRGPSKFTTKVAGDDVQYGHEVVVHIKRNKLSEGSGRKALFNFYSMQVSGLPLGIDRMADVINTAKRLGVIKLRGSMHDLPDGTSHQGYEKAKEYLADNADSFLQIRDEVLQLMLEGGPVEGEEVLVGQEQ